MSAHLFPSDTWASAYEDALNNSPDYARAGRDWTHGAVAMVVLADAALDLPQDMAIILDVDSGKCRSAKYINADEARALAPFVVEGTYVRWSELIRAGEDPIKALMQGKFKLTKGHLPTMIRYVESSKQLLVCAQKVDSQFRN